MLTKRGIAWIIVSIIILGFIIGFSEKPDFSPYIFVISAAIILFNVLGKELAGKYFYTDIEHKIWEFQQFGFYKRAHFKKPFPIGLVLPFALSLFSLGIIKMMTLLQFDGKPSPLRILKKRGLVRKSEVNESDFAFIAAWGLYSLILLALICAIFKIPDIGKFAVYYGIWNLIPFGQLDGSKLFFGSIFNWILLALIFLISLIIVAI